MWSVKKLSRLKPPRLPFGRMAEAILGAAYELSLVFIDSPRSRALNRRYRHENRPANILSFPLAATSGEIFIDLPQSRREATANDLSWRSFVGGLFIHGLLHLKGWRHSSKMEDEETFWHQHFFEHGPRHHHRIRHWQRHRARGRL